MKKLKMWAVVDSEWDLMERPFKTRREAEEIKRLEIELCSDMRGELKVIPVLVSYGGKKV
jgi:hypothetical protein